MAFQFQVLMEIDSLHLVSFDRCVVSKQNLIMISQVWLGCTGRGYEPSHLDMLLLGLKSC